MPIEKARGFLENDYIVEILVSIAETKLWLQHNVEDSSSHHLARLAI